MYIESILTSCYIAATVFARLLAAIYRIDTALPTVMEEFITALEFKLCLIIREAPVHAYPQATPTKVENLVVAS